MGGRFWVTGVELALLQEIPEATKRKKMIKNIMEKRFIGNFSTPEHQKAFEQQIKKIL